MKHILVISALTLVAATRLAAAAQPGPADLDPAVETSPESRPTQPARPPATPAPTTPAPATQAPPPKAPATPPAPAATPPQDSQGPAAPRSGGRAQDRVELEATQVTGNRELPRVMYVVPWKKPDLGDLGGRPAKSLLDEVLAPVDRDVFRRENRYYDALRPDAKASEATAPQAQ